MRLRNNPLTKDIVNDSLMTLNKYPILVDESFILEVGMGKGEMLTQLAFLNPNNVYIGIEKYATVIVKALKKAEELNLKNFFVINEDLSKLNEAFLGQVKEIWLTFSDPWIKKRHYKRRLTHKHFLEIYKNLLCKDGILKIKTDNDLFFEWSKESIEEFGAKIVFLTNDLHNSFKNDTNIQTEYEKKWSKIGKNINYMEIKF